MEINLTKVLVKDLVDGYIDNQEYGVVGYSGTLNIRPPYQREFVYNDKQREAVIDTVTRGFPINTMYWAVTDTGYEIIDGQQRTVSICQYVDGIFSFNDKYFHNLHNDEKQKILNYELTVYQCSGTDSEKLDWFRTINISGEELTEQELRNAVYAGSWTADAKRYFSKTGCAAYQIGSDYLTGSPIRQDYLEIAIRWISSGDINGYMAKHQHDANADDIWNYFQEVISWIKLTFPVYRREMKGLPWGELYNLYKDINLNAIDFENKIRILMADDEVTYKKGIYPYLLTNDERTLNIRCFSLNQKREMYEQQLGICPHCNVDFKIEQMEADHITPWAEGGTTELINGQMLCRDCNRRKSNR